MSHDQDEVRDFIDGDEIFMTAHSAHRSRYASRGKTTPAWAKSDKKIQKLLLEVFPKLHHNERQRKAAARWARVIYLYYRTGLTYSQIAEEMGISYAAVNTLLRSFMRAATGRRANGSGFKVQSGPGRPKNRALNTVIS